MTKHNNSNKQTSGKFKSKSSGKLYIPFKKMKNIVRNKDGKVIGAEFPVKPKKGKK